MIRRLALLVVLALGLVACGTSGASNVKITFGTRGGTLVPFSATIASDGAVTSTGVRKVSLKLPGSVDAKLSGLVRTGLPSVKSEQCPGTFADESAYFITALGKTVTVRGTCEPNFDHLWSTLASALDSRDPHP